MKMTSNKTVVNIDHFANQTFCYCLIMKQQWTYITCQSFFTYLEQFQSLASELTSPRIQTDSGEEIDKAASVTSAYRLSTSILILLDLNNNVPSLE